MRFRFQTILNLRKNQEDQVKRDFGRVNQHVVKQEETLQFLEKIETDTHNVVQHRFQQGIAGNATQLYDEFFEGIKIQKSQQKKVVDEAKTRLEAKREELVEAMRRRRVLEILKERNQKDYEAQQQKLEQSELDEIAAQQHRLRTHEFLED